MLKRFVRRKSAVLSQELLSLQLQAGSKGLTCTVITMKMAGDALVPDGLK